ncbi:MAG TPA: hypothetical protein VK638_36800 [Edaphobacter sp.]|nr:hypothetical protein [Edaphobacter sp.]
MATNTGITTAQTFVFEQTRVARYVALAETAGGFILPDSTGSSDRHFQPIEFPGVIEIASVIFYRTRHTGRPSFSVRINEASLSQYTFRDDDPPERSWHEIIPARVPGGSTLRAQNNELVFAVSGDGTVIFGDVVILYTSNELTVKIPIVLTAQP